MTSVTLTGTIQLNRREKLAPSAPEMPRIPHLSRLMAMGIKIERQIRSGRFLDQAHAAQCGHVTRARMTQIMNLLHLAPDIQEELLFLPPAESGRDRVSEPDMRPIAAQPDWRVQRRMWRVLTTTALVPTNARKSA